MSQFEENRKKAIAEKLRKLVSGWEERNKKRLPNRALADAVHVSRETVNGWMNGKTVPDKDSLKRLCAFFSVKENYFDIVPFAENDLTLVDEKIHATLNNHCASVAEKIGLSAGFMAFVKESPALADLVVSASWIDAALQSLNPDVPAVPENLYQLIASSNVKIYPSDEALYMLRVVQRDVLEFAENSIKKWSAVIDAEHSDNNLNREIHHTANGEFYDNGEEHISPIEHYVFELQGRGSLKPSEALLVDMYSRMNAAERQEVLKGVQAAFRKSRKRKS